MNRIILIPLLLIIIGLSSIVKSQDSKMTVSAFSLKDAQDYAIKNNLNAQNATIDVAIAEARKNQTIGLGLPQVSTNFDIRNNLKLPTSIIPASAFNDQAPPDLLIPLSFGVQYNITGGIQVSQLLFSSDYLVGLQATKVFMDLSKKSVDKTVIDIKADVIKAYYNVLISKQRAAQLNIFIAQLEKLFNDSKELNKSGFIEKIDVDRLEVAFNNLNSEKEKIQNFIILSETLLKFQMGYDVNTPITLTEKLEEIVPVLSPIDNKVNFSNRVEYGLLETQLKANELDLKRYKLGYLPTVAAYGNATSQYQGNVFSPINKQWYPFYIIGVQANMTLFDGLQNKFRINGSKLSLLKTKNNQKMLQQAIQMETSSAGTMYNNSVSSLTSQKRNMQLAEEIFRVSKIKYEQGVGSNMEVLNAETSLKESSANYYSALYDYLVAKTDYDKAIGAIK